MTKSDSLSHGSGTINNSNMYDSDFSITTFPPLTSSAQLSSAPYSQWVQASVNTNTCTEFLLQVWKQRGKAQPL
jgi:hypothetical protein